MVNMVTRIGPLTTARVSCLTKAQIATYEVYSGLIGTRCSHDTLHEEIIVEHVGLLLIIPNSVKLTLKQCYNSIV